MAVLRTIGVSYTNGMMVTCAGEDCKNLIRVRDKETARIFKQVTCNSCGESFDIIVPEDPFRELTQDDLNRKTAGDWRKDALAYYKDHPEVIPSPIGLRRSKS